MASLHSARLDEPLRPRGEVSIEQLAALHDPKSIHNLAQFNSIDNLARNLGSSVEQGLTESDFLDRQAQFGANVLPSKVAKSFFRLCLEAFKDKVLVLLSVAAAISLALGLYETFGHGTEYDEEGKPLPKVNWVEGVAIIVAVLIVVIVGAANDYQKERQFAKLNAKKEDREVVVIRNGDRNMILIFNLMVGDVIGVETGDVVPADLVLISGEVECDESALTGESDTITKRPAAVAIREYQTDPKSSHPEDPFLISGAKVLSGVGTALVTAVGEHSIHGRTMMSLSHELESTPLQERLDKLADGISRYGFLAALVLFVVLLIRFGINIAPGGLLNALSGAEKGQKFVDILIVAVTIVVVAVPEGLPLAVTLALAFATTRMAQNGNLVRVLRSCETMGGATAVCLDKTGTLTENRMTVVRGYVTEAHQFGNEDDLTSSAPMAPQQDVNNTNNDPEVTESKLAPLPAFAGSLPSDMRSVILDNIVINSTAFENPDFDAKKAAAARQRPQQRSLISHLLSNVAEKQQQEARKLGAVAEPFFGNKTELALLIFARDYFNYFSGISLDQRRQLAASDVVQVIPFELSRKWAGVVVRTDYGYRLLVKGAAEIVFRNCGDSDRAARDAVWTKIDQYANDALRAIMLAHRDFNVELWPPADIADPSNPAHALPEALVDFSATTKHDASTANLTMDFLAGIQDPLKDGVPEAVAQCKMAGVTVRMVTGDNLVTAKAISRGCNILTPEDSLNPYAFMEGPTFRQLDDVERARIVPQLRVLARLSPEDKRILVETLRNAGEVVAVTGDGTNDAPALKLADVGFSMGVAGTEVAREASDIILMTDDFTDIVQAIKWGRTVAESIKKFIQFQLTVNITACVLTFVSAVASLEGDSVLTAVQLLWVNLIMDTLAALALATDKPDDALLQRKPAGRLAPLISVSMWKMIMGQSIMQLVITFTLHFGGHRIFFGSRHLTSHENKQLDAMTFNAFVWLQFWKLFVTRKLDECADVREVRNRINAQNLNFFSHLFRNWYFVVIALLIGGCQILIMFVGGAAFSTTHQPAAMWGTAIIAGMMSLPMGAIIRIIPNWWVVKFFPTRAFNTFLYYAGFNFLSKKKRAARRGSNADADLEKNSLSD